MQYTCPVCGEVVSEDLQKYMTHTENHIVDIIKEKHPGWVEKNGLCHKCVEYYRNQLKGGE